MRRLRAETDDLELRRGIDGLEAIRALIQKANGHADNDGSSRDVVIADLGMLHQRLKQETRKILRVLDLQLAVRRHEQDVYEAGEKHAAPITSNMGAVQEENSRRFILPKWSPVVCVGIDDRSTIAIELIDTKREGSGLGTMAFIALMQGLADNQQHLSRLEAHECFFPTYYVTNAMYGWTVRVPPRRVKKEAEEIMRAAPRLIYPRWLHQKVEGDPEESADRDIENMVAEHHPVDLCWASPALWHENRCRAAKINGPKLETSGISLPLQALKPLRTWRDIFGALAVERERPRPAAEWPDAGLKGVVAWQSPLHRVGDLSEYNVEPALTAMGNNDISGPLCMLLYPLRGELPAIEHWDALGQLVFRLVVAYLIDYGRVMWRPLVIDAGLARRVMQAAGVESLTDLFDMTTSDDPNRLMPALAPYFHFTGATGGDSYVWIPTRKPRETSSWAGTDRIPLPRREKYTALVLRAPASMEEETGEGAEPPSKKPRFQCHFCARYEPEFADPVHFFCDATCQLNYYA